LRRGGTKKNAVKPWLKEHWVLPNPDDPDFVCAMEDVLDVYQRPPDEKRPLVTLDEASKQLVADVTPPVAMQPGRPTRQDYEYERRGTANLFMLFAPLAGWRHVKVTDRRTIVDFAHVLRDLSEVHFPEAEKIVLVMDNLNTHKLSTLYRTFPAEEARRLYQRFEVHHTPKHASWLNMAECELSVLGRQCLDRRIDSQQLLTTEVANWEQSRNEAEVCVDWQFHTADARIKLKRLYPTQAPVSSTPTDH
jgi:DDE superfamily endonuclease